MRGGGDSNSALQPKTKSLRCPRHLKILGTPPLSFNHHLTLSPPETQHQPTIVPEWTRMAEGGMLRTFEFPSPVPFSSRTP